MELSVTCNLAAMVWKTDWPDISLERVGKNSVGRKIESCYFNISHFILHALFYHLFYLRENSIRIHVEPGQVRYTDNVYIVSDIVSLGYRHGVRFLVAARLLRLESDLEPLAFAR